VASAEETKSPAAARRGITTEAAMSKKKKSARKPKVSAEAQQKVDAVRNQRPTPRLEGDVAYKAGRGEAENPYAGDTDEYKAWAAGWEAAARENAPRADLSGGAGKKSRGKAKAKPAATKAKTKAKPAKRKRR
jgi:hypothetical protein